MDVSASSSMLIGNGPTSAELAVSLARETAELFDKKKGLQQRCDELTKELSGLDDHRRELDKAIRAARNRLLDRHEKAATKSQSVRTKIENVDTLAYSANAAKVADDELAASLKQSQAAIAFKLQQIVATQTESSSAMQFQHKLKTLLSEKSKQLYVVRAALANDQAELAHLTAEVAEKSSHIQQQDASISKAMSKIGPLTAAIDLDSAIAKHDVSAAEADEKAANEEAEALVHEKQSRELQAAAAAAKLASLRAQAAAAAEEAKALRTKTEASRSATATSKAKTAEAEEQMKKDEELADTLALHRESTLAEAGKVKASVAAAHAKVSSQLATAKAALAQAQEMARAAHEEMEVASADSTTAGQVLEAWKAKAQTAAASHAAAHAALVSLLCQGTGTAFVPSDKDVQDALAKAREEYADSNRAAGQDEEDVGMALTQAIGEQSQATGTTLDLPSPAKPSPVMDEKQWAAAAVEQQRLAQEAVIKQQAGAVPAPVPATQALSLLERVQRLRKELAPLVAKAVTPCGFALLGPVGQKDSFLHARTAIAATMNEAARLEQERETQEAMASAKKKETEAVMAASKALTATLWQQGGPVTPAKEKEIQGKSEECLNLALVARHHDITGKVDARKKEAEEARALAEAALQQAQEAKDQAKRALEAVKAGKVLPSAAQDIAEAISTASAAVAQSKATVKPADVVVDLTPVMGKAEGTQAAVQVQAQAPVQAPAPVLAPVQAPVQAQVYAGAANDVVVDHSLPERGDEVGLGQAAPHAEPTPAPVKTSNKTKTQSSPAVVEATGTATDASAGADAEAGADASVAAGASASVVAAKPKGKGKAASSTQGRAGAAASAMPAGAAAASADDEDMTSGPADDSMAGAGAGASASVAPGRAGTKRGRAASEKPSDAAASTVGRAAQRARGQGAGAAASVPPAAPAAPARDAGESSVAPVAGTTRELLKRQAKDEARTMAFISATYGQG